MEGDLERGMCGTSLAENLIVAMKYGRIIVGENARGILTEGGCQDSPILQNLPDYSIYGFDIVSTIISRYLNEWAKHKVEIE